MGIPPQEDAWLGKATERIFLAPIKMTMVPEIIDMEMPVEGVFHNLVIAKIKKEFAGQGQKVMYAMWGAGQMMFNKILVIADELANIKDYAGLARQVFKNLDVSKDVFFATGPMDVLDHSCSKMGFGGKMCIDGTRKFEEELDEQYQLQTINQKVEPHDLLSVFPEIALVNTSLPGIGIPCLLIAVKKSKKGHVRELHERICKQVAGIESIKMVLYVEYNVNPGNIPVALWRFCNNLDPKRDNFLCEQPSVTHPGKTFCCLGLDGTRKTKEWDDFQRDWPNIIVADDTTIEAVDKKWDSLNIGRFISSPSLQYKSQMYGSEAVVED